MRRLILAIWRVLTLARLRERRYYRRYAAAVAKDVKAVFGLPEEDNVSCDDSSN